MKVVIEKFGDEAAIYVALIFGAILFVIRKWALPLYAFIEVFFGMYGTGIALLLLSQSKTLPEGFQKLASSSTDYPQYVGLMSSTYVIVRGLDNWERWIKEKEKRRLHNI